VSGVISWRRVGKNGMKPKILYGAVATVVIVVAAAAMAAGQSSNPAHDSGAKDLLLFPSTLRPTGYEISVIYSNPQFKRNPPIQHT
jgi:hypothetical protein